MRFDRTISRHRLWSTTLLVLILLQVPSSVNAQIPSGDYDGTYDLTYQHLVGPRDLRTDTLSKYIQISNGEISSTDGLVTGIVLANGTVTRMTSICPQSPHLGSQFTGVIRGGGGQGIYRCVTNGTPWGQEFAWSLSNGPTSKITTTTVRIATSTTTTVRTATTTTTTIPRATTTIPTVVSIATIPNSSSGFPILNDPPTVRLYPNSGFTRTGSPIKVVFEVKDDSKRARVFLDLYSGGSLVETIDTSEFIPAIGGKLQSRYFQTISYLMNEFNGPFYVCVRAVDEQGNWSDRAPHSSCQWRSIEAELSRVTNKCGAQGYGDIVDMQFNLFLNWQEYGGKIVDVSVVCDLHDAAYAGLTVYDPINKRMHDFRTWSRDKVDAKFYNDFRKMCHVSLKDPNLLKNCIYGPTFSKWVWAPWIVGIVPGALTYWGGLRYWGWSSYDSDATTPGTQNADPVMTTPIGGARINGPKP